MQLICARNSCKYSSKNCGSELTHFSKLISVPLLKASPMPNRQELGHLSSAIQRQALCEIRRFNSSAGILIASSDTNLKRSFEEDLYDVKNHLHAPAS